MSNERDRPMARDWPALSKTADQGEALAGSSRSASRFRMLGWDDRPTPYAPCSSPLVALCADALPTYLGLSLRARRTRGLQIVLSLPWPSRLSGVQAFS